MSEAIVNLTFVQPPLGLDAMRAGTVTAVDGAPGLFVIRDSGESGIRLFVVDVALYVPTYVPRLSAEQLAAIGITDVAESRLFVVATLTDDAPTVNLLAPIVMNRLSGDAAQVILDEDWPLRAPLADYATA